MIDTHTHIYMPEFDADRTDVVARAMAAGVSHLVLPNVDLTTIEPMQALHAQYPDYTSMAMGFHPTEVNDDWRKSLDAVYHSLGDGNHYVAIGEVGIDLYWDKTFRREQREVFSMQLKWANELDLPVIIHCRDGLDDVLAVFKSFRSSLPRCVFHSFTGTINDIRRIRLFGDFYFGINGIVTFKKSEIPSLLPHIGLNRILLETDSPYLAPIPNRGKRNESANIPYICACIARNLGLTDAEVSAATDRNAHDFFRF
jgi:TatD DNase family protein